MNRRWLARGLVAGLHLALLAALWFARLGGPPLPAERPLTTVRLIVPLAAPTAPRATAPTRAAPPRQAAPAPTATPAQDPAPAPMDNSAEAAPAPAAPATAAEPPRTTLRLALPPGYAASSAAARNPALDDRRANSPRPTLETRIANAAAVTGDWVEERTSDERMRRRRGDTCVETVESRIALTDPFNGNVAPRAAAMTGQPYKCQ